MTGKQVGEGIVVINSCYAHRFFQIQNACQISRVPSYRRDSK